MAWDVYNPKGRISSILSVIIWTTFIVMIIIKGDFSI